MADFSPKPDIAPEDLEVLPLERAETIPAAWCSDPRFHELDKEAIFARSWQGVGHASRVRAIGDQIIATVADNPILIVRGDDDHLRAFYNVCRHRG